MLGNVLASDNGIHSGFHAREIHVVIFVQCICLGNGCVNLSVVGRFVGEGQSLGVGSGVSGDGDIRAERLAVVRSDRDRIDPGLQVDGTVRERLAVGSDNNIGQFGRGHRKRNGILRPGKKRRTVRVEAVVAVVLGELVVKFLGFHGINGFCGASGKSGSATGSNIFRCGIVVVLKNRCAGFNLANKSA